MLCCLLYKILITLYFAFRLHRDNARLLPRLPESIIKNLFNLSCLYPTLLNYINLRLVYDHLLLFRAFKCTFLIFFASCTLKKRKVVTIAAVPDRLLHYVHVITLKGGSHRMRIRFLFPLPRAT